MSLGPEKTACASGSCLDMASFLTYRVLAGNDKWHDGLCSPKMFSGSIPEPMLWFPLLVAFLYVMQCRLRARRSRASSMVFRPWPLRTEIVPDSLNLWMILCTVDDDNFKLFAIFLWETPFWYCSTIFRRSIGGIGDPLPILTSERHCHSERLFLYPIMLPIDLIICKLVLQLFLICTFNFSGLLLLPVPTFLECVALMKSKMSQYLAWHFKMSHFQHLICYLYSIVNKI